jgi:hypothetical protein
MKEKLLKIVELAKNLLSRLARILGVLDGDGKVDEEKVRVATEWAKEKTIATANEVSRLGKEAMKSDMVKDAAAGAVVGAAIAVPVPVIGPLAGGTIGAGLGVYKNIVKKETGQSRHQPEQPTDVYAELVKFDELRQKGIITDAEFETRKKLLLAS